MARRRPLADTHLARAYEQDARRLLIWLTRRTYDAQLAVDLVAETYARAWEARRRFQGDPDDVDAITAWTWGIARHVLSDALRRGRSERRALRCLGLEPPQLAPDELARLEEVAELGSLRAALATALQDLSAAQREAVRLRVVDELGYPAIARRDVASARSGLSPQALAARRVQTYYDPVSQRTWAFGAAPPSARDVQLESRAFGGGTARTDHVAATAVAPEAIRQGHLPAGVRVFVVALPGARDVARVVVRDDVGAVVATCTAGRCDR